MDLIGRIPVPDLADSGLTFPLKPDAGFGMNRGNRGQGKPGRNRDGRNRDGTGETGTDEMFPFIARHPKAPLIRFLPLLRRAASFAAPQMPAKLHWPSPENLSAYA